MPRRRSRVDTRASSRALDEALLALSAGDIDELTARMNAAAQAAQITYQDDDGVTQLVPLMLRPRVLQREQEDYFHRVCLDLNRAIERLAKLYLHDERVRALMPFTDREDRWLRDVLVEVGDQPQTVIARLDANADFLADDWDRQFHFFETNTVGVGGMYYAPAVAEILRAEVLPVLRRSMPDLVLEPQIDQRQLLLDAMTSHARDIRRSRAHIAFVQEAGLIGGPNEMEHLAAYCEAHGSRAVLVDPRELVVRDGELFARDVPVDVVYREAELAMFIEMEAQGDDLTGLKHAFMHNQVVSSFAGELDHKSAFEVLTTPELASSFTQRQQRIFRHHVLWTRLVRETQTTDSDGTQIDLVPWLRRNKDRLVLKPNRSFGGMGIVVGPHVDLAQWDDALAAALSPAGTDGEIGGWVAQRYVDVRTEDFPMRGDDGRLALEEMYVVCGFLATTRGVGILSRASKRRVVNVGQKGGLTGVLVAP